MITILIIRHYVNILLISVGLTDRINNKKIDKGVGRGNKIGKGGWRGERSPSSQG